MFNRRPRLGDTPRKQRGLDRNFLARQEADVRFEGLVAGQCDLDAMLSSAHEHPVSHTGEFADGAHESIVNKNSGMLLDVSGSSTTAGAKIIQWTSTGGANQQWVLNSL